MGRGQVSLPFNCRRVCLWLSRGEAEGASRLHALLARAHLALCPHCRRYRRQLELIGDAARLRRANLADPSWVAEAQRRIVRQLLADGSGHGGE